MKKELLQPEITTEVKVGRGGIKIPPIKDEVDRYDALNYFDDFWELNGVETDRKLEKDYSSDEIVIPAGKDKPAVIVRRGHTSRERKSEPYGYSSSGKEIVTKHEVLVPPTKKAGQLEPVMNVLYTEFYGCTNFGAQLGPAIFYKEGDKNVHDPGYEKRFTKVEPKPNFKKALQDFVDLVS